MAIAANVTILIPDRKVYCDFAFKLDPLPPTGSYSGIWEEINYKVTPPRQGYSKFNFFVDLAGDAFLDRGTFGFNFFLFKFGTMRSPTPQGLARIDMDVLQNAIYPKADSWAKKAELIPQMKEIFAIFWQ
jgi:hypothetical protein